MLRGKSLGYLLQLQRAPCETAASASERLTEALKPQQLTILCKTDALSGHPTIF